MLDKIRYVRKKLLNPILSKQDILEYNVEGLYSKIDNLAEALNIEAPGKYNKNPQINHCDNYTKIIIEENNLTSKISIVKDFEQLDYFIDLYFKSGSSIDVLRSFEVDLDVFIKKFGKEPEKDPFSEAYCIWEKSFVEFLYGKAYDISNEGYTFQLECNPYEINDIDLFCQRQQCIIEIMKIIKPKAGASFLEMGCGLGDFQEAFGRVGVNLDAIEASKFSAEYTKARCNKQNIYPDIHNGSFYDVAGIAKKFDIILFEASFHHCDNPVYLLKLLRDKISDSGKLFFVNEPLIRDAKRPWGVIRNDGEALYQIRKNGWIEYGFDKEFFSELLKFTGWQICGEEMPIERAHTIIVKPT